MISTRGRYAIRIMIDLAEQDSDKYIPLKEIAARQEISKKYLEHLAIQLIKADLLKGTRGHNGGYRLTKPAEEIRVIDVLNAVETSMTVVGCLKETSVSCPRKEQCKTLPLWTGLQKEITDYLSMVTLQDIVDGTVPE